MAKKIKFNYEDVEYTLEYNRNTVRVMEHAGFDIDKVDSKPMTMLPMLFAGAFKKNHPKVKNKLIDEIYDSLSDKQSLVLTLAEMYGENLETLMAEPDEDAKNNRWTLEE